MSNRRRIRAIGVLIVLAAAGVAHAAPTTEPEIQTRDVETFYKVYDAAGGHPTVDQLQHDYLEPGTVGLHQFAQARNVTAERIAQNIAAHPEIYEGARECMAALPGVRARLAVSLRKLIALYPDTRTPPVTIVVGRGKPAGIAAPGKGVQIGLEALCAFKFFGPNIEDRFVHVISHEYIHVQQDPKLADDEHPTVLERSLIEGAAEFIGEMISGDVGYAALRASTAGHETEIESKFVADEDKTDLSDWIDNSTMQKLGDLGYWVGYRIVKSYYQHAPDKAQAIRDIIEMNDPKAFLARSGWHPGIVLQ
jgi:Predicted Zn-dependent protease (DUF2268)